MQTLKEKLKEDLKIAIKSGNALKKDLIKVVLSEIALEEGRGKAGFVLNDEGVTAVLKKCRKNQETTKEACEKLQKEIPESVLKEIEILESYLPKQMNEDQVRTLVSDMISEIEAPSIKDMGLVMTTFNKEYAGKADNKIVSQIVREKLNG